MKIQRDSGNKRNMLRLSASKKEELAEIMSRLRFLIGSAEDKKAHTVQIVFTSDKIESVLTIW